MANFRPFPLNGTDPWGNPIRNWASDVESNISAIERVASDAVPNTPEGREALAGSPELSASIAAVVATVSDTIRNTLLDGLRLVRVTQAEYDALPTPRPVDVLYVVTN